MNHRGVGETLVADDKCMVNGLCQNFEAFDGTNTGQQLWWRQSCTDPTWQSPYCLVDVCSVTEVLFKPVAERSLSISLIQRWYALSNAPMRNCGGYSWCCGKEYCCKTYANVFQLAATVGPTSPVASATSASSTANVGSSTSANTPVTFSRVDETSSAGLSTGAKAGIGVGVAVVVLLAIAVTVLLLRLRKFKSSKHNQIDTSTSATEIVTAGHEIKHQPQTYAHRSGGYESAELGPTSFTNLAGNNVPQELDAPLHIYRIVQGKQGH